MKRALIASFAALGIVAAPVIAATAPAKPKVTKTEKKTAKVAAKNQQTAAKTASKSK